MFVDNCYTNVPLFLELEKKGIRACGTVRGNKKYLPEDIVDQQCEQVKSLVRGESLFRQSGNLICVTWKDRKLVHLLSTLPEGLGIGQVERKVKSRGQWQRQNIAQPQLINLYNSILEELIWVILPRRFQPCSIAMTSSRAMAKTNVSKICHW